ncbi:MAG: D-alanyl-D-alanine carboxypeptidase [Ruminococcaceae bacterium]|nr:D-alanyl-D-alanine carboxypeptidase [Oscillospiraceae bacterium]
MKKIIVLIVLVSLVLPIFARADLTEDEVPVFSADDYLIDPPSSDVFALEEETAAAILIEADSGEVLFEVNPDERLPIASVTKVMTLLLIMEALDEGRISLSDTVAVSEYAASMGGSQAFMEQGEKMTVNDMLKAISVSSCNDAAVAMAEHLAGSESEFVSQMNKRASELGMTSTEFVNCTGLDDREMHYSSARDVALMSRALLSHPKIFEYTTIWMDSIRDGKFGLANTNKLIRFYEGANGLKTGSTSKARYCLTASAERDGMMLCAVVLGAPTSAKRFSAARSLLDYGFANFSVYRPKLEKVNEVKVVGGKAKSVKCHTSDSSVLLPKSEKNKVEEVVELPKQLKAPVKKGDVIGKVKYVSGDKTLLEKDIVASADVKKAGFFDIFKDIWSHVLYGK